MVKKRPIIFSHERSGTHFLMNTLGLNFGCIAKPWIDFDWTTNPFASENILQGFKTLLSDKELNVVKSHHEVGFFEDVLMFLVKHYHVFYIYRETDEVMESMCRHLNDIKWDAGPKCKDANELGWSEPSGALMRYQKKQYPNMRARHTAHIQGWRSVPDEIKSKIIYVRYKDLNENFDNEVRKIAKRLNVNLLGIRRPGININVVTPVINEDSVRASLGGLR
jgi:hypothetical protein